MFNLETPQARRFSYKSKKNLRNSFNKAKTKDINRQKHNLFVQKNW